MQNLKTVFFLVCVILQLKSFSQSKRITLDKAIEIAKKKSPDYKINLNNNQRNYWRFKNYKASFLPELRLNATLPDYSNSIRRITNDLGQDVFVNQNQLN